MEKFKKAQERFQKEFGQNYNQLLESHLIDNNKKMIEVWCNSNNEVVLIYYRTNTEKFDMFKPA